MWHMIFEDFQKVSFVAQVDEIWLPPDGYLQDIHNFEKFC